MDNLLKKEVENIRWDLNDKISDLVSAYEERIEQQEALLEEKEKEINGLEDRIIELEVKVNNLQDALIEGVK
jgi:hypothetical protein